MSSALRCLMACVACVGVSVASAGEPPIAAAEFSPEVAKLMLTARSWSADEIHALAKYVRAPRYVIVPADAGPVSYESGNPMLMLGEDYGKVFEVGDTALRGVMWNFTNDPAVVRIGEGPDVTNLPPGTLLIVGDAAHGLVGPADAFQPGVDGEFWVILNRTLSVKCGAGYYACCTGTGSTMKAVCIRDNSPNAPVCDGGGPGSSECSISD